MPLTISDKMDADMNSKNTKVWFTADTHFGHGNLINLAGRPFSSLVEMDETLISNWNSVVGKDDVVIHLGDFALMNHLDYISRLNGYITFVRGNHDDFSLIQALDVRMNGELVTCVHNPDFLINNHLSGIYLVGHIHHKWKVMRNAGQLLINVGVDVWDFKPVSVSQIVELIDVDLRDGELMK